jgi:hypothetical protein
MFAYMIMEKLTSIEKLDATLQALKLFYDKSLGPENSDQVKLSSRTSIDNIVYAIVSHHTGDKRYYTLESAEIRLVLLQLLNEKYCTKTGENSMNGHYEITFAGLYFYEKGGYKQQQADINSNRDRLAKLEAASLKNEETIATWTARLGYLTVFLVIIGFMQILLPILMRFFYNCNPCD